VSYASGHAKEGSGLTAGFGVFQSTFDIDYAIRPVGVLGLFHYISIF